MVNSSYINRILKSACVYNSVRLKFVFYLPNVKMFTSVFINHITIGSVEFYLID